ncbi:MAG TPA: AbrB/MazE/SpoVT family DNA-binding domain-containing protein [Kineosporiaceae bacterium]
MTAPVVPAVIPTALISALVAPTSGTIPPSRTVPVPGLRRTPLPLAELPKLGDPAGGPGGRLVCGAATMDCNGRLADATVIAALGWGIGARLDIRVREGLVIVSAAVDAVFTITRAGHLRLPAPVRHRCGLVAGDRLLLVADPDAGTLLVYPPRAWRTMIIQFVAGHLGSEEAAS